MPVYTTGSWKPLEGEADAFVDAWREFAKWASAMPGAGEIRLARDLRDSARFVSIGVWDDIDSVREWKSSPEFKERMSRVQKHVDAFAAAELEVVETLESGASRA
jgi:heme-degrading monooxygenase HmoA